MAISNPDYIDWRVLRPEDAYKPFESIMPIREKWDYRICEAEERAAYLHRLLEEKHEQFGLMEAHFQHAIEEQNKLIGELKAELRSHNNKKGFE